jgi:O-antigen ligase
MGFYLVPHNYYIMLWFELGLAGLGCFILILRNAFATILAAARQATREVQLQLIASAFSILILMVGLFLDQLFKPWLYIWPYFAVTLRAAFLARDAAAESGTALSRTVKKPAPKPKLLGTS